METAQKQLQNKAFDLSTTTRVINLGQVFASRESSTLNEFNLFIAHFNYIPNYMSERNIDCKSAIQWFRDYFKNEIKEEYFNRYQWGNNNESEVDDMFFFLYEDLLVNFDTHNSKVKFLFKKADIDQVEAVVAGIKNFLNKPDQSAEIFLLVYSRHGIELEAIEINEPSLSIEDNYNDDFQEIHHQIVNRLGKDKDKGLVLLHGKPGTGKTSYIRYLISAVKKRVIFLPLNMASSITDPNFISILIQYPNSILVIEDAENIILDRSNDSNSPVSTLLNLTDGLLSDCLNIQVVCSFNTDLSKVDSALLRKGRLIAKYEFGDLEVFKAQALSDKLGFKSIINKPQSLTSIYNQGENEFGLVQCRARIGFRANSLN